MFSLASVATMAACIFMFGLFYIIVTNFSATVHSIEEGVSVTVFLNMMRQMHRSVTSEKRLISVPRSAKTSMCLPTRRGKNIKSIFSGKEELADGFTDNPLANSAHYQVYLNDVSMQDSL